MRNSYLNHFIKKTYKGHQEINTLDDFLNFKNDDGMPEDLLISICCDTDPTLDKQFNCKKMLKECLDLGMDLNATKDGKRPYIFIMLNYKPDLALFFFENGGYNKTLKNFCATSPWYNLVTSTIEDYTDPSWVLDKIKILNFFNKQGEFKPDFQDVDGNGLLHLTDTPQIAQWLLKKGCDPKLANLQGQTPVEYHQEKEQYHMVKMLTQYKAQKEHLEIVKVINHKQKKKSSIVSQSISMKNPKIVL